MSQQKERTEKICLNCGAVVYGRYCHFCGQENVEIKETFWQLLTHFVYDIIHFDGKFFSTLKYLLFKPGFLSHEHLRGRRASYLHPIRMYVFTSAFFFLLYFSFFQQKDVVKTVVANGSVSDLLQRMKSDKIKLEKVLQDSSSSLSESEKVSKQKKIERLHHDIEFLKRDTTHLDSLQSIKNNFTLFSGNSSSNFNSFAAYDSAQQKLSKDKRDGYIVRSLTKQNYHLQEKYKGDGNALLQSIFNDFKHRFPQILFISLPLFALILMILYHRNKQIYYVNHVVFSIHLYCAFFIIVLFSLLAGSILEKISTPVYEWFNIIITLIYFFYLYKAMRNFYEQGRGKTILKYGILLFVALIVMALLFGVFFLISALSI